MLRFIPQTITTVAISALALSLTGCGGSDPADETTPPADVEAVVTEEAPAVETEEAAAGDGSGCDMLDLATLESISGQEFSEPTSNGTGDSITCDWEGPEGTAYVAQVSITDAGASNTAMTREVAESMFEDVVDVDVPGASDAFSYMGGVVVGMSVGDDYVQVMYMDFFAEDTSAVVIELATEVVGNL